MRTHISRKTWVARYITFTHDLNVAHNFEIIMESTSYHHQPREAMAFIKDANCYNMLLCLFAHVTNCSYMFVFVFIIYSPLTKQAHPAFYQSQLQQHAQLQGSRTSLMDSLFLVDHSVFTKEC